MIDRKTKKILLLITALLMLSVIGTACTNDDPHSWPKSGVATSVPRPEAGDIQISVTKEASDGKEYAIIIVENFDVYDMGDYIRLLLKKGFVTAGEQTRHEEKQTVTYSAKKGKVMVCLELDLTKDEIRIEID